jgi:hypothetical protein
MLSFLIIFALGVSALLLVQSLDIECANPPKRRAARHSVPVSVPPAKAAVLTYSA